MVVLGAKEEAKAQEERGDDDDGLMKIIAMAMLQL